MIDYDYIYQRTYYVIVPIHITLSSNAVLGISPGIDSVGDIRWELLGYLVVAWVGAYLVVWKGLHNSSKV